MMVTAALMTMAIAGAHAPAASPAAEVLVNRKFVKGEYNSYRMNALLVVELKQKGLETFIPTETGYEYAFNTQVHSIDPDGNASMRYDRGPTYRIDQDFANGTNKRVKESDALKYDIILTPINHFIEAKEVKPATKPGAKPTAKFFRPVQGMPGGIQLTDILAGQYISDLYRLSLFVGSLDSSFDFSPKLPEEPIKVGDTWLATVSYQPQKLSGTNRQQVQRLDMTYRYDGPMTVNNKKIERISATLGLDNDLVPFINQTYGMSTSESPLKSFRLKFDSKLTFDLEPKTFKTLRGQAISNGLVVVQLKGEDGNYGERKITGESNFVLLGSKIIPVKPAAGGARPRSGR